MAAKPPKIYTKTGDKGSTALVGGQRVSKGDARLEVYGTVDELNSFVGVMGASIAAEFSTPPGSAHRATLLAIVATLQNELFNLGSQLACEDKAMRTQLPAIDDTLIRQLEGWIDDFTADLKPLRNFILPGGSRSAADAHVCRTVCRRAERLCVRLAEDLSEGPDGGPSKGQTSDVDPVLIRYLNRLSDFFFVFARHLNRILGIEEPLWSSKAARS